jgi:esterase/lipase
MDVEGDKKGGKRIYLKSNSDRAFFMIHGYSGSPMDFSKLPQYLQKEFGASVYIPVLKGHGTKVEDLDDINYGDFISQIEEEFLKVKKTGKKIVIVGISFGAQLVLYLAAKYKIEGVVSISPPYKMKFPFNLPGMEVLGFFKKYWKKPVKVNEREKRIAAGDTNYSHMHSNGLKLTKKSSEDLSGRLINIKSPCLVVTSKGDRLGNYKSGKIIIDKIGSKKKKALLLNTEVHNLFYSPVEKSVEDEIGEFISENIWKGKSIVVKK